MSGMRLPGIWFLAMLLGGAANNFNGYTATHVFNGAHKSYIYQVITGRISISHMAFASKLCQTLPQALDFAVAHFAGEALKMELTDSNFKKALEGKNAGD
jgi:hypothetical protein